MALIFPRLAQNFVKNGYFPTDEVTMSRVMQALDIAGSHVRILDPCCGEGVALMMLKQHLIECGSAVTALGVEFDAERAWHAKTVLDRVIHSDVNDVFLTARSQSLLFLNPPYGDVVSDKAGNAEKGAGKERLEKIFYRKTVNWLQFGGVMVLIVPYYVIDKEFASMIARHFTDVQAFMAPEQQFKQAVIFGVKKRADTVDPSVQKMLEQFGRLEGNVVELPEYWSSEPYLILERRDVELSFTALRMDAKQLEQELNRLSGSTLWPQFTARFEQGNHEHRAPLRRLSDWHLALALAAGQISGVVKSEKTGQQFLIKGDTFKSRDKKVAYEQVGEDQIAEIITYTDKFVPAITAIDFTPGEGYGRLVTIK